MSKSQILTGNETMLFRKSFPSINKIVQDTIFHTKDYKEKYVLNKRKRNNIESEIHSYFFSCPAKSFLINRKPVYYIRDNVYLDKFKKLRSGKYVPEIFLDLHGLTLNEAKRELGCLISICHKEKLFCASIMHGHGKNILKKQIPLWLVNHPDIMAFHQAPKTFGSNAAIFILIQHY